MEWVKDLIIVCAVGAVAAAIAPASSGRGVKILTGILVILTAVSPIARFTANAGEIFKSGTEAVTEFDASSYDGAVLEQTASVIASYVRDTLEDKYGLRSGVRISVLFDDAPDAVKLSEIHVFCGVRFDSYRDREIEDELSRSLGCDVFIFSE